LLKIIDPLNTQKWDELIEKTEQASFFHGSAWARVLSETYHYKPVYFSSIQDERLDSLLAAMEINSLLTGRRGVSLPFTDFCPVLGKERNLPDDILKAAIAYGMQRKWRYLELRDDPIEEDIRLASEAFYEHSIELDTDSSRLFHKLRANTKRNILKAKREGMRIRIERSQAAVEAFYDLHCLTRKRHGMPIQPYTFFRNIHDYVLKVDYGFITSAYFRDKMIASMLFLKFKNTAIYKYGASDINYQALRPNNLVMWEAMEWLITNGFNQLNLGRTEMNNPGLRQFKNGWNSQEKIRNYYRYNITKHTYVKQSKNLIPEIMVKLMTLLPVGMLKLSGKLFYRHAG
jgi:lipid II:glycine glycyltransferase (peptidoglycan interpeptide bridge formation enzyme)